MRADADEVVEIDRADVKIADLHEPLSDQRWREADERKRLFDHFKPMRLNADCPAEGRTARDEAAADRLEHATASDEATAGRWSVDASHSRAG